MFVLVLDSLISLPYRDKKNKLGKRTAIPRKGYVLKSCMCLVSSFAYVQLSKPQSFQIQLYFYQLSATKKPRPNAL